MMKIISMFTIFYRKVAYKYKNFEKIFVFMYINISVVLSSDTCYVIGVLDTVPMFEGNYANHRI